MRHNHAMNRNRDQRRLTIEKILDRDSVGGGRVVERAARKPKASINSTSEIRDMVNRRRVLWTIAALGILAIVSGIGFVIYAVWITSHAEMHLHAMRQAVIATQIYVVENDGRWPRSWADLKKHAPDEIDLDSAAESVAFDVNADPAQLATQTRKTFTGIRPAQPCYNAYEYALTDLIETLAKYSRRNGK